MISKPFTTTLLALLAVSTSLSAQQKSVAADECARLKAAPMDATMDHAAHSKALAECAGSLPTLPGQAAFGAIAEVVRLLENDPATDWSKVNIEALRQHLIDMDDVIMHSSVAQRSVPGGLEMTITGAGTTAGAIKRMVINHARMLDGDTVYNATARELANGAAMTVTAKRNGDARTVAKIRGLGFAGLMTEGDHHAAHHLALARGDALPHGR